MQIVTRNEREKKIDDRKNMIYKNFLPSIQDIDKTKLFLTQIKTSETVS